MFKGGTTDMPKTARIFRFAGLLAPAIFIIYGTLIQLDYINAPHPINVWILYILSFWWVLLSLLDFFTPKRSRLDSILRLACYHLLIGSYLIFVAGITSPFSAGWLILMIMSFIDFPKYGLQISAFSFLIVIMADYILWGGRATIVYDLITIVSFLSISIVVPYLTKPKKATKITLDHDKSQESLQQNRVLTIINNLSDAVISTNSNGTIKVYNAASLNLLDTNDSLNGKHINEILPLTDQDGNKVDMLKELQNAKTTIKRDDLNYSFDENEKMRLEITFSPIHNSYSKLDNNSTNVGYVIIMRDVTKAKSLEEERDEFISVISHELRTPITIAEGTISNVQIMMERPDIPSEMLKDAIKTAHDQVIFLANMVNDLSALSRAERGVGDDAENIDVQELAHKLINKYTPEATAKSLALNLDLSPTIGNVFASRLYLEELLQNFITNAIKYTKEGSIDIKISQKNNAITFAVKDSGIGISKTDQAKVFNKFYRSEDYRTRETGGTGLGLYVAAKLANKLGTKIQLISRLNFGSTFSFSLPKSEEKSNN